MKLCNSKQYSKNYEARYQSERQEILEHGVKLGALISLGLFAAFAPLDILEAPDTYFQVSMVRAVTVLFFGALYLTVRKNLFLKHSELLIHLIVAAGIISTILICLLTGGYESRYFAGVSTILLGSSLVFPWTGLHMATVSSLAILSYLTSVLVHANFSIDHPEAFFSNLGFVMGASVLSVAGAAFKHHAQRVSFFRYLDLERAQKSLQKSKELKDSFFANLSHELRTPLALILGPTKKLIEQQGAEADASSGEYLKTIERNAQQLLKQVNDLLDASRLEAGGVEIRYSSIDISDLVQKVSAYFKILSEERGIELTVTTPDHLWAEIDPDAIERVLMNLLSNALKFTQRTGKVSCVVEERAGQVVISVSDSGPGVPESERELVFERFYQVDDPLTRGADGTGLGLSISKDLVELHHGEISIHSSDFGGAEFQVEVPLKAPQGTVIHPRYDQSSLTGAWRSQNLPSTKRFEESAGVNGDNLPLVLVIEDNVDFSAFLKSLLSPFFRVAQAHRGREGVEMAREFKPDLILSDVMMPQFSGVDVLDHLKNDPGLVDIPVIILTAKQDESLRLRLLKTGAVDYIIKPFAAEELLARVENAISIKKTIDLLKRELQTSQGDLESLVGEMAENRRRLKIQSNELELARVKAVQALGLREEFISIASHELRTPLTSMSVQTQMAKSLLELYPEDFSVRSTQLIRSLDVQVERLVKLVNEMFDVSAIERGCLGLSLREADFTQILKDIVASFSQRLEKDGVSIKVSAPASVKGCWDPLRIGQVISNLISNAIKHGERSPVEIELNDWGSHIEITVRDYGPGIPKDYQKKIFDRFERHTNNKAVGGLGLGLYICQTIVRAHGGELTVESEIGRGATFTVSLPKWTKSKEVHSEYSSERYDVDMARVLAEWEPKLGGNPQPH